MLQKELERRLSSAMKGIWSVVQEMTPKIMEQSVYSEAKIEFYHQEMSKFSYNDQAGNIWAIWENWNGSSKVKVWMKYYTNKSGNRIYIYTSFNQVRFEYWGSEDDISHNVEMKDINMIWTTYKETRK